MPGVCECVCSGVRYSLHCTVTLYARLGPTRDISLCTVYTPYTSKGNGKVVRRTAGLFQIHVHSTYTNIIIANIDYVVGYVVGVLRAV